MSDCDLPYTLAQMAHWEYDEINSGTTSRTLDVGYKSGIVPINHNTTNADIELTIPAPGKAGIVLCFVFSNYTGNYAVKLMSPSSTNKFMFQTTSGAQASYRSWTPDQAGSMLMIMSIPMTVSGTRTYVWAVVQAIGSSTSYFSAS